MPINKWTGKAQPRKHKKAMWPRNISPGSVWKLRVGATDYLYQYSPTVVENMISYSDAERIVVDGIVSQVSGGGLFGGGLNSSSTVESSLVEGRWAVVATGSTDGTPLDIDLVVEEAKTAGVSVIDLQVGSQGVQSIQVVKWPKTPTGGNLTIGYEEKKTSVAYNASASTLATALNTMFGVSTVTVAGTYIDGYTITFVKPGKVSQFFAFSSDAPNIVVPVYSVESGGTTPTVYSMDGLNGDAEKVYRFVYGDDATGHLFSAASNTSAIRAALESIESVGSNNATVVKNNDGKYVISLVGGLSGESTNNLFVVDQSTGQAVQLTKVGGDTTAQKTVVTITFKNRPAVFWASGSTASIVWGSSTINVSFSGGTATTPAGRLQYDIQQAISTFLGATTGSTAFPWLCTSVSGGPADGSDIVVVFESSLAYAVSAVLQQGDRLDVGIVKMSLSSTGCNAISVVEVQRGISPKSAIQQVSLTNDPDGGTFTLTHLGQTTAAIAYNASAATVSTALGALSTINPLGVTVTGNDGGPWVVEFIAGNANQAYPPMTGNGSSLTITDAAIVVTKELSSPTGPNWYTDVKNWSQARVPNSTDTVVFEECAISCLYGISNVPAIAGLIIYRSFTGTIGLPEILGSGQPQTLPQYLSLSNLGSPIQIDINLGQSGDGPSLVKIDTQSQTASVNVPYSAQPSDTGYTIQLAGALDTVSIGGASVGFAISSSKTVTINSVRVSVNSDSVDAQSIGWGKSATINSVSAYRTTLIGESVPKSMDINSGSATIQGSGNINSLELRDSDLVWQATGNIGQGAAIESLTMNGSNVKVKSTAHGLSTGTIVWIEGLVGVDTGYYPITVNDADNFTLIGSAINSGLFTAVYGTSTVIGSPWWGKADAVRVGGESRVEFASVGGSRKLGSPILLQSTDSTVVDQSQSVSNLSWRCDPGFMTKDFGRRAVFARQLNRSQPV